MFSTFDEIRHLEYLLVFHHEQQISTCSRNEANTSFHKYFHDSNTVYITLDFAHRRTAFAFGTKMTDKELQINK